MTEFDPHSAIDRKDNEFDGIIRPQELDDFTGQREIVSNLHIYIQAAKMRGEALDHVLFHGPPGLGKTTLAHIIAHEMGVNMKVTSGPVLDKPGDLAGLLTSLETGDVLFIDEIHRLSAEVEEYLYSAMEDYVIDIMIDKGPGARSVRISLNPFSLVGATTRSGLLTAPLRARFGISEAPASWRSRLIRMRPGKSPSEAGERPVSPTRCCGGCAISPRCWEMDASTWRLPVMPWISSG